MTAIISRLRSFNEQEAEQGRAMREGWHRYKVVLRDIGIVPTWEHQLAFYAGWAREED